MDVLRVGEELFEQRQVAHVHRRLVAPARLARVLCVRLEDRRDRVARGHPGADSRRHVVGADAPRPDRRDARHIVDEPIRSDGAAVPAREEWDEERLVGDRHAARAVEDHAQQRRPRAADPEYEEWRRHSGATTSTAARAARPPTVTYSAYAPGVSGARRTRTSFLPTPRRPAKSHPYDSASVSTRTENRFPAATSM